MESAITASTGCDGSDSQPSVVPTNVMLCATVKAGDGLGYQPAAT